MTDRKKQIEIEHRSRISKRKYNSLKSYLNKNAIRLGKDDKNVYFFIFADKFLKVTDNISQQSAKITLKFNKIGEGSHFEEIEIPIQQKDAVKAVKLFKAAANYQMLRRAYQKRDNYKYKQVEIALKYSAVWNYHVELEVVISDIKHKKQAEKKIFKVADELGLRLMNQAELSSFIKKFEKK